MNITKTPRYLPRSVTIGRDDVENAGFHIGYKPHARWFSEVDPNDCPLVRALRRVIPTDYWINIWMADDYVVQLDTPDGLHFEAELDKLDRERFRQSDTKRISPANHTVSLSWHQTTDQLNSES